MVNGSGSWTISDGDKRYTISKVKVNHRLDVHRRNQDRSHTLRMPDHADPNHSGVNSYLAAGYASFRHTIAVEKRVFRGIADPCRPNQGVSQLDMR